MISNMRGVADGEREAQLLAAAEYFRTIGFWPSLPELDPSRWLDNFDDVDKGYALDILESFVFLNEKVVQQLYFSALHEVSNEVDGNAFASRSGWTDRLSRLLVVPVRGESPHLTDSGLTYAKLTRKLGFVNAKIRDLDRALVIQILSAHDRTEIVLVDDFAGGAHQVEATLTRPFQILEGGYPDTLASLAEGGTVRVSLAVAVVTWQAAEYLAKTFPFLHLHAGMRLDRTASCGEQESDVWTGGREVDAASVLQRIAEEHHLVEAPWTWTGHNELGLLLGMHGNNVPDSTITPVSTSSPTWKALYERQAGTS